MFSIEFFNDESNGEFDELLDFLFLSDGLGFDERFEDNFVVVWKYICVQLIEYLFYLLVFLFLSIVVSFIVMFGELIFKKDQSGNLVMLFCKEEFVDWVMWIFDQLFVLLKKKKVYFGLLKFIEIGVDLQMYVVFL